MVDGGAERGDDAAGTTDGRSLRRENNVDRALDAFAYLMSTSPEVPTLEQVAVEAGLSVSSIYRYFGHVDDLFAAVSERGRERFSVLLSERAASEVPDVPLGQRIELYLAERRELRGVSAAFSAKSVEMFSEHRRSSDAVLEIRSLIRERILKVFEPELAASESDRIRDLRATAIYVAGSMPTRQYLLNECGYNDEQIDAYHSWQIAIALGSPTGI